jgi:hypothetical protein
VIAVTTAAVAAASALGMMTAAGEKPKMRTMSAGIQNDPGILSRVIVPAGSNEPKKKFGQLRLIDSAIDA